MAMFDFHLLKLEHALIFQIIDQQLYNTVFMQFEASNDWKVDCDTCYYPNIELENKIIYVRNESVSSIEDKYHTQVLMFKNNEERDKTHDEIKLALREWAIKARKFNEISIVNK